MAFINPYTFINFPQEVRRRAPLGHAPSREQARERYTGSLTVTWNLRSPIAIPNDRSWGPDRDDPVDGQEIRIPGASAKGAVRSLHEALFAGCARIIDPLFTPVYREIMTADLVDGWQLGVVTTPDANVLEGPNPDVTIMPCKPEVTWVRGDAVRRAAAGLPKTGDFVLPSGTRTQEFNRVTFSDARNFVSVSRGNTWASDFLPAARGGLSVLLITDTSARDKRGAYYWATAPLDMSSRPLPVSPRALTFFRRRIVGADRAHPTDPSFRGVTWPPPPAAGSPTVAQRRSVDGWFRQGDVLWVRVEAGQVVDIKLSVGWRAPAGGKHPTVEQRIPRHVQPCRHGAESYDKDGTKHPAELCLSCSIFGSVDATADDDEAGKQRSYGGHVRFGDITGECTAGRANVQLAPLGTPHLGAGMYYLSAVTHDQMERHKRQGDLPSRWDSSAGESTFRDVAGREPRQLRGRKFYWHANPEAQRVAKHLTRPRYERTQDVHDNEATLSTVHLVEAAELTQTITFDGLDAVSLATLLASLSPGLVLGEQHTYGLHLGRAKPLGLGSVTTEVQLNMTSTADRYTDNPQELTELPDLATTLADEVPKRCGDLTGIINQAKKVLDIDGLGEYAADVAYPTMHPWSTFNHDEFHQSYEFFQKNNGQVRKDKVTKQFVRDRWAPLPVAEQTNQRQG